MPYDWNLPALKLHDASTAQELGDAIEAILTKNVPHLAFLIAFKPRTFDLEMYTHPQEFQKHADKYVQSTHRYDRRYQYFKHTGRTLPKSPRQ